MSTATVTGGRVGVQQRPEGSPRPPVRAVPAPTTPARAPFVVVMLLLLTLGLGTLLLLNTLLAQGSFTLHALNDRVAALTDNEQALQQRASELAAPQRLARRAQALGMVASQNPAFLNEADGKVLGEPVPASAPVPTAPLVDPEDSADGSSSGATGGEKPDSSNSDQQKTDQKNAGDQNSGNQNAGAGSGGNGSGGNGSGGNDGGGG